MKRFPGVSFIVVTFVFIFALVGSTAQAKPCLHCRTELPERARFCLTCGQACQQLQPELIPSSKHSLAPLKRLSPKAKETLLVLFSPVDDFGRIVNTGVYSNIVGGFPEFKITFGNGYGQYQRVRSRLPEELQILGDTFVRKAKILSEIVGFLRSMRMDSSYKDALVLYYGYVLTLNNAVIQKIRESGPFSAQDLVDLRRRVANIENRTQRYEVTAKFLKIGKETVKKGSVLVVFEVKGKHALVLNMGETASGQPIEGWVSLEALKNRTTWTSNSESYF